MTVVKFPYEACRRIHSRKPRRSKNGTPEERAEKASQEVSASATVTALPIKTTALSVKEFKKEFEDLPWRAKREIAAQIEASIEARMPDRLQPRSPACARPAGLKEQREARYEAWGKAGARACFWKALIDLDHALFVAQREKMPEALLYDPIELGSASWHATRRKWQDATDRQLLTPAPNMGCVVWKQRQKFSHLRRDQIERAIADDLAWLKRFPASERRVRRTPE